MCTGLVGWVFSVLKGVLACLLLRRNLHVLVHGMGCAALHVGMLKRLLWPLLTAVHCTALWLKC